MDLWAAELNQPREWIDRAAATLLPAPEADRSGRETEDAWSRRIVARAALRVALGRHTRLDPASLRFRTSPAGKPELAWPGSASGLHFNVSHSGGLCVLAISEAGPVGVDVEALRPVRHLEQIAARFGADDAAEILRARGEDRLRAFLATWTRREACLKAAGTGLAAGLGPEVEDGWDVIALELGEGYVGALSVARNASPAPAAIAPRRLPLEVAA